MNPRLLMQVFVITACCIGALCCPANGQFSDDQFDEDRYLRGLNELNLPEVMEHYLQQTADTDELRRMERSIALDRLRLRGSNLTVAERVERVDGLLATRSAMIDQYPDDPRRAQWLADQAADIYFELLHIEAAAMVSHLGVPSAQQRQRAARGTQLLLDYALRAERATDRVILELESTPGFTDNITLQLERRRIIEELRDRQIPFLHGIGLHLHAAIVSRDAREQRQSLEETVRTLTPLGNELHPPLNFHARLHAAFANARLGRREAALAAFNELMYVETADRSLTFSAEIGAAMYASNASRELNRLAQRFQGPDQLFFRLLVADAQFRLQRERSLDDAVRAYTAILSENHGVSSTQLRDLVLARLTRAIDLRQPTSTLPHIALIARASRMAQDTESRHDAISTLKRLIDGSQLQEEDRVLAIFVLAETHRADRDALAAATRLIQLAREHTRSSDAERAIELGVGLAAEAYRQSPEDAIATLRDGLNVLLRHYPNLPTADRWGMLAGQIALAEARFDGALEHFSSIQPHSEHAADAAFMKAQTLSRAAMNAVSDDRASELHQRALQAASDARRALTADRSIDREQLNQQLATLHVIEARTHLALDEPRRALSAIEEISADAQLSPSTRGDVRQIRITAYYALAEQTNALREIEYLIAESPDRVPQVLLPKLVSIKEEVVRLLDSHDEVGSRSLAQRELEPIASLLERCLAGGASDSAAATVMSQVADAYRYSGRYERALDLYDTLLERQPNTSTWLFGRAECLFHLAGGSDASRQLGEAMMVYRRLTTAGPSVGEDVYWQSHLRSLQILDQMDRNTQQIVPQIQRLRQLDREMGGERLRRGFDALQNKHS